MDDEEHAQAKIHPKEVIGVIWVPIGIILVVGAGNFEGKSEIPDFSIFPFSAVSDPGTLKIGFLGKNQYRTPRPRLTTPHLVEFSAENVKFPGEITIFGLPQFPAKKNDNPEKLVFGFLERFTP